MSVYFPWPKKEKKHDRHALSFTEAGKIAGVSRWTIRLWVRDGKLSSIEYPGMRGAKVDQDELEQYMDDHRKREPRFNARRTDQGSNGVK